jgi:ornithine cyclodeaminase/alanine dehydrogenase-like protein (mu-crystallin family)
MWIQFTQMNGCLGISGSHPISIDTLRRPDRVSVPGKVLVLTGNEIRQLLDRRELEIIEVVRTTYEVHHHGQTSLPQSSFLRFSDGSQNRIIALPAYIGGENRSAGIKWIASFPGNSRSGLERASAVVILNSVETGLPIAILEGSDLQALPWRQAVWSLQRKT